MTAKRKVYSAEFKTRVALCAIREEASLAEISCKYGVNANLISKWKKQAEVVPKVRQSSSETKDKFIIKLCC